ncbi:MAG: hypothetical protein ACYSUT_09680 [Planctomycetota bacterium]
MEPTENRPHPKDIVDTTDSLEAVGACRSMKNFLFWVILVGLLVPQMVFWLDRIGLIERSCCPSCASQPVAKFSLESFATLPLLTAEVPVEEKASEPVAAEVPDDETVLLEKEIDHMPPEIVEQDQPAQAAAVQELKEPIRISCKLACVLVAVCNFLVLIGAMLYCLTLLMCLKISLTGRLGGLNHVTRAFFVSLLLLVILVPWQKLLPGVLVGTVWLPGELLCTPIKSGAFWKALFYLRFVGLWVVAVWLLFWAQIRSAKWAQATLRRLGLVR